MNNFNISEVEAAFMDAVRECAPSSNIWYNRPKATDDSINDFVVVKVSGGVSDRAAYGECRVYVQLFARDIKEMKNTKKLLIMQNALSSLSLQPDGLLVHPCPRVIGDTPDDFGFHARIISFKVYIKVE